MEHFVPINTHKVLFAAFCMSIGPNYYQKSAVLQSPLAQNLTRGALEKSGFDKQALNRKCLGTTGLAYSHTKWQITKQTKSKRQQELS